MKKRITLQKYLIFLGQSIKDWKFWTKLIIGLTQISSITTFLIVSVVIEGNIYAIATQLSYFTTLSNLLCAVFFIYSAMFHYAEGRGKFDNSEVARIVITYITLTILMYNLDQIASVNSYFFDTWKYTMSFFCEHSLVPFLAIIYYLFFYNHENAKSVKEFSQKWIWYMIAGLINYLTFFSIIGLVGRFLGWRQLFGTIDGSGEGSTFVYPFMDWYHGVGFFKHIPAWFECIIMLTGTVIIAVVASYIYTFIILKIESNHQKEKSFGKQKVKANQRFKKDEIKELINISQSLEEIEMPQK